MLAEYDEATMILDRGDDARGERVGPPADFWVFAYGSLIWNPGFAYEARVPAKLLGYRRAYCIVSRLYRGTPTAPGLVLGLEPGGHCEGVGYRVAGDLKAETMRYLRQRELVTNVYDETLVQIETRDGERHRAFTYVANAAHDEYVAMTDFDAAVATIAEASGSSGPNCEYAINTWSHLAELGIRDGLVERVADALRARDAVGS